MANMSSSTGSAPSPPQPVLDPPDVCRMIAKSADITSCKFRQLNSVGIGVRRRLTTAAGQLAVGHRSGLQLADPSDQKGSWPKADGCFQRLGLGCGEGSSESLPVNSPISI